MDVILALFCCELGFVMAQDTLPSTKSVDRVWHQPPPRTSAESNWLPQALLSDSGQVVEIDGNTLRLELPNSQTRNIETSRIVWLEPAWKSDSAAAGMEAFAAGQYPEAIPNLLSAIQAAPPVWHQQWLGGHLAMSAVAAERYTAALEVVAQISASRPPVPMYALLPIHWTSRPMSGSAVAAARQVLTSPHSEVRLVAASWLLSEPNERELAERTLEALSKDRSQPQLAALATVVRWRRTPVPQIEKLSEEWLRNIDRLPIALQGGPLICVADRLQAAGAAEKARDLWLTVLVLHRLPKPLNDVAQTSLDSSPKPLP
jgi:hypothetical protein